MSYHPMRRNAFGQDETQPSTSKVLAMGLGVGFVFGFVAAGLLAGAVKG